MGRLVLTILVALTSSTASVVYGDIGTASSYHPPYIPTRCYGNRQDQFPPSKLFVAVSEGLWDNGAACGRRYRLRCLSGANRPCKQQTIEVKVVDFCTKAPCPSTIQLSTDAFAAISNHNGRKINVEYTQYVLFSSSFYRSKIYFGFNNDDTAVPSLTLNELLQDLSRYYRQLQICHANFCM
ncbi:hypothetical protein Pint_30088 [Pistacia integerrima]|uniref:Uncharacterized protein n=1 Tax=Pistacia integerrima TaxID=434235 RepID=A0ACC0WXD6_9ROSI|nr:hypothetical protein Pint_30088 [Pistacia integerrima]